MHLTQSRDRLLTRAALWACAALVLTTVHHVYGAYVYDTPWRLHAGFVSVLVAAALVGLLFITQRGHGAAREIAFWGFVGVTLLFPVVAIGLFEGLYNHAVKNALYFGGASASLFAQLFPPPTYELPNDLFFEATGIMQVVPSGVAGWLIYRLVHGRLATRSPRAATGPASDTHVVEA